MKNLRITFYSLSLLLLSLAAGAQTITQTPDQLSTDDRTAKAEISVARCQYTQADDVCAVAHQSGQTNGDSNNDATMAQLPRRGPMPPRRPTSRQGGSYSRGWAQPADGHAVAIGALVGFGVGAAAGAGANTDARGRVLSSLLIGSLGALMGAAVGHAAPAFRMIRPHLRDPGPDEDELASGPKQDSHQALLAAR